MGLAAFGCRSGYHPVPQPPPSTSPKVDRCVAPEQPMAPVTADPAGRFPRNGCVERAAELVRTLSLEEKLGQMMQPERAAIRDPKQITTHGFGSILSGGGSAPSPNTPVAWAQMVNAYREASLASKSAIPMLYGVDAVHGHNNVAGAVIFPHNIGLGASRDAELVQQIGRATAEAVAGTQIDWDFAPVLAAARDERWGRTYEAYGETEELAELLGPAMIRGLQGDALGQAQPSVLACAKHYLGDGYTSGGKDQGDAEVSEALAIERILPAYREAIAAGVGSVMVSYSSLSGKKMHCHGHMINDILKGELGFRGFVISDYAAIEQLPGNYSDQLASAINAGVDMVMAPKAHTGFITTLKELVPARVPEARIDDAVTRILATKCSLGLLDEGRFARDRSGQLAISPHLADVGSAQHRALARRAVRESLVLLKNDGVLPLKPAARVHVVGRHADDVGLQSGGWTITWQGSRGPITDGTTLLGGLREVLGAERISYSASAAQEGAEVNVLAIGETPYAEYKGDSTDLRLPDEAYDLAAQLGALDVPLVVVLFTGRPVVLGPILDAADALVAAWLPGSEGAGIADVLSGKFDFVGQLPHTWPRSVEQVPINVGDAQYDPLFAYGFGQRYAQACAEAEGSPCPAASTPTPSVAP